VDLNYEKKPIYRTYNDPYEEKCFKTAEHYYDTGIDWDGGNKFVEGDLEKEHGYVLDRKKQPPQLGNYLARPTLLLRQEYVRKTEFGND